jgi:hypothetical protein
MVSVLASSAVDRRFKSRSGQAKDYKIGICYFFAKHAALRSKSKDWLALIDMYFIGNYQNESHVGPSWTFGIGFAISQYMQYEFI